MTIMQATLQNQVVISEVGPRDGLQSVSRTMATADKLRWITALHNAGLREIEVCSFVPAKHLPQMADAAEVVKHALTLPGLWRQHARYGAGAYRYLSARPSGSRRQSARFYLRLLRRAFTDGVATGVLVMMTQVATVVGLAREVYRARAGR